MTMLLLLLLCSYLLGQGENLRLLFMFDSSSDVLKLCAVLSCDKLVTATRSLCTYGKCARLCLGRELPLFQRICRPFFAIYIGTSPQKLMFGEQSSKNLSWLFERYGWVLLLVGQKGGRYLRSRPFCLTQPSQRPAPAKWFDSSTSDVSDKVADFPLVLAAGHCAKIIDVRARAANAYLPYNITTRRAPNTFSARTGN